MNQIKICRTKYTVVCISLYIKGVEGGWNKVSSCFYHCVCVRFRAKVEKVGNRLHWEARLMSFGGNRRKGIFPERPSPVPPRGSPIRQLLSCDSTLQLDFPALIAKTMELTVKWRGRMNQIFAENIDVPEFWNRCNNFIGRFFMCMCLSASTKSMVMTPAQINLQ